MSTNPASKAFSSQDAWDELIHKDDRTSPEEYPDMCLISFGELQDFMTRFAASQEPVAWRWCERPHDIWRVTEIKPFLQPGRLIEPLYTSPPAALPHDLYKTGDKDAPDVIKDRNGDVALGLCRRCGKGEIELSEPCTPSWRHMK